MTKSLRESLGAAYASSSLTWDAGGEEAPIDRMVASAWTGERLGRLLARLKYGGDRSTATLRTALWKIVEKNERRGYLGAKEAPTPALIAMCACALDEWMNDRCTADGCVAGWLRRNTTKPSTCRACNGLGRLAWSDEKRRAKLDGQYDLRLYERILRRLQEADARHFNQARKGLADGK
jgi:hypothetical protein